MATKRHKPEEIVTKLRQVEVLVGQGMARVDAIREVRIHDLSECPTMAIEWFEEKPEGTIIEDLKQWRREVDGLFNPIHKVFYELALFAGFPKGSEGVREDAVHADLVREGLREGDLVLERLIDQHGPHFCEHLLGRKIKGTVHDMYSSF